MTQSDKTREKLIASIRKTKGTDAGPRAAESAPQGGTPAPAPEAAGTLRPGTTARTDRRRGSDTPDRAPDTSRAGYALGGLRWPD